MKQRRFVVLDRDGTIIIERHYLTDPSEVELLPGSAAGLRHMRELGLGLVVITNQSAVGRGFIDKMRLSQIHERLHDLLKNEGVHLDGIYSCPHLPEDNCSCRKPAVGLLSLAANELRFDPRSAFVIGDKACDIEMGKRVGATIFLVRTGYGEEHAAQKDLGQDYIVEGLQEAATVIGRILAENRGKPDMKPEAKALYERVRAHLLENSEIIRQVAEKCLDPIMEAAGIIANAFKSGGKVLLCGNGGSAADCQHMAAEFVGLLTKDFKRPGLRAIALTTDTSLLTAYANDFGFEGVFARQVETLGSPGDVLIGISTSGNSENIIRAVEAAQTLKMTTIVLTGKNGRLAKMASAAICVPSTSTEHIQESHIAIEHALCDLVECYVFDEKGRLEG